MSTPMVIIGAGGFGREVLDIVSALADQLVTTADGTRDKLDFLGFIDDGQPDPERLDRLGARHLGGSDVLADLPRGTHYAVGIANGDTRRAVDRRATAAGLAPLTLVHPAASSGADVRLGPGTVVCAGVRITTNVRIGRQVHLNLGVTVGHDAVLADYVTVNPLVAVSGNVTIGEAATVGTTACINQGLNGRRRFLRGLRRRGHPRRSGTGAGRRSPGHG